jgi:hypothetical protein
MYHVKQFDASPECARRRTRGKADSRRKVTSRAAAQKPVPIAVADADMATAERPARTIVELIIGSATIRAVIDSKRDIKATMVAESSRQEKRILPVDMDQKTICG